ncbi:MAG: glycosyltransferase family 2 protein [Methanomicrobiales archaeon]|nr:glycosyltransferase family 2 protein [Methanomicrobiales archaeon]
MTAVGISAVIPVYNDRDALARAIPASIEALAAITDAFELIIAEDGSTDGSADLVRGWEERDARVRLLHADERLGRGRALERAFAGASGSIVCYYDVDLATSMEHLPALVGAIRDGYDIATGSRLLPRSDAVRTPSRNVASRAYNFLVRLVLKSRLYDHQCGFKAFSRARLLPLLSRVAAPHWFWDTEVLVRAQREGYRIAEIPVVWRPGVGTTVRANDVLSMGSDIIRLWWQLHVEKN